MSDNLYLLMFGNFIETIIISESMIKLFQNCLLNKKDDNTIDNINQQHFFFSFPLLLSFSDIITGTVLPFRRL